MTAISCPHCGHDVDVPVDDDARSLALICPSCSSRLAVSVFGEGADTLFQPQLLTGAPRAGAARPSPDPAATVPLGSGTALLGPEIEASEDGTLDTVTQAFLILAGAEPGSERFTLTGTVTTVGRQATDIVIPDPALSSHHFEIEIRGGEYFVRDLGSSNGTFLNGDRIRAAELSSGDIIRAGQSSLTFRTLEALAVDLPE